MNKNTLKMQTDAAYPKKLTTAGLNTSQTKY